jgi:hypothetical protein
MEPLSIATSVVSLTSTCLTLAKLLGNVCSKYKAAPQLVTSLQTETKVIGISLSQLQRVLLSDADSLPSQALLDPEVISAINIALTGCSVTLSCLEEEIRALVDRLGQGLTVVDKAGVVWKDDKFKDLLHQLRGQCSTINLLLTSLQMYVWVSWILRRGG